MKTSKKVRYFIKIKTYKYVHDDYIVRGQYDFENKKKYGLIFCLHPQRSFGHILTETLPCFLPFLQHQEIILAIFFYLLHTKHGYIPCCWIFNFNMTYSKGFDDFLS